MPKRAIRRLLVGPRFRRRATRGRSCLLDAINATDTLGRAAARGRVVRFPYGGMPAYPRELLADEDLRAIYSYLKSLPPAPELKDLPLLYDTSNRAGSR